MAELLLPDRLAFQRMARAASPIAACRCFSPIRLGILSYAFVLLAEEALVL